MPDFSRYKTETIILKMGFLGLAEEVTATYEVILGMTPEVMEENSSRAAKAWMDALIDFAPHFADFIEKKYTVEEREEIFAEIAVDEDMLRAIFEQYGLDEDGNPTDA